MRATPLLQARRQYHLKLPLALQDIASLSFVSKEHTSCLGDEKELKALFPHIFGHPLLEGKPTHAKKNKPLKVGVVLSGGQAAGGHNVIIGIYDALQKLDRSSSVVGFLNGPGGVVDGKYKELKKEELDSYRNTGGFDMIGSGRTKIETDEQLQKSLTQVKKLGLDGLVIIGGDDSNTNAAVLAEYFKTHGLYTQVIGVPKTIDGDLQNTYVDISFGFDTACKTYSEMIGNLARDALSAKKYTHFVKLMGRSASHIALECALQTHPNLVLIGEEVSQKKYTLKHLTEMITDLVIERSKAGKDYGLILLPEGLIEQIPEMGILIQELSHLLSDSQFSSETPQDLIPKLKNHLSEESSKTFSFLPEKIQRQLLLGRDPHGNVQVALIETESLLIETVSKMLKERNFTGKFSPITHFFGYEGRAGFPSNFDATYCYALGFTAAALIKEGYTGYMACVTDLIAPVEKWTPYGLPLTSLMHLEVRKGKRKPVIEKALVDLEGEAFKALSSRRNRWKIEDEYCFPGPIQFYGDPLLTDQVPLIVQLKSKKQN